METVCKDSPDAESVSLIQACDTPAGTLSIDERDKQQDEEMAPIGFVADTRTDGKCGKLSRIAGVFVFCCVVVLLCVNAANTSAKHATIQNAAMKVASANEVSTAANDLANVSVFSVASVTDTVKNGTVVSANVLPNLATDAQIKETETNATAIAVKQEAPERKRLTIHIGLPKTGTVGCACALS
jgi:hypothetical protein